MELHLRPMLSHQLLLLSQWLYLPDIKIIFGDPEEWLIEIKENLATADWVNYFLLYEYKPIGFCQYYNTQKAPPGDWSEEPAGTVGIDFMIADPADRGQGKGARMLDLLLAEIRAKPETQFVISDPELTNVPSVKLLEKYGFQKSKNNLYRLDL